MAVVQEVYESTLILAQGYNDELIKSEAEVIEDLEQALGEPLRYSRAPSHSAAGERIRHPAA